MINYIHPAFKLNGLSFKSIEELRHYALHLQQSTTEEYLIDLASLILEWFNEDDYVVLTTSGTTGPPKKMQMKKSALVASAKATGAFFQVGVGAHALLCMSTKFVGGKLMLIRSIILGWQLDVVRPSSTPLSNNSTIYDFVAMVPLQVQGSLVSFENVKQVIIGGAKVSESLRKKLLPLATKFYETYGMTETVTHIAAKAITEDVFHLLPHAQVSTDSRGCLVIDVPLIAKQSIVTNDLVKLLDHKTFQWLGRIDNVINSGGVKLYPEQIEEKLTRSIPYRFFIGSKEDDSLGNKVILVIESEPYQLPENIFEQLHKYERPKEVQFVSTFVETASGKIKRKENIK